MKKWLCCLMVALSLFSALPGLAQQGYIYVPKTESATLRRRPNKQSKMVKYCKPGVIVEVLGSANKSYYKINYKGTEGYVVKGAVRLIEEEPVAMGLLSQKGYTTGHTRINIRQQPKKAGALCGEWETGTEVEIFAWEGKDYAGKWYEIQAKGVHGWVQAEFLTITELPETPADEELSPEEDDAA